MHAQAKRVIVDHSAWSDEFLAKALDSMRCEAHEFQVGIQESNEIIIRNLLMSKSSPPPTSFKI